MTHRPIVFKNVSLSFPHKLCFDDFSLSLPYGSRIALIGQNGSGKSTLLKILQGIQEPTSGDVVIPEDVVFGYVPQMIAGFDNLSGGQRFNKALTQALNANPNVLLLDEPTNHLDRSNRISLMRMLKSFPGTLIIVSHDVELIRTCIDTLWHIDNGQIHIFSGNYDDYLREIKNKRTTIEQELSQLNRQKKDMHQKTMKEQARATKSRAKGKKKVAQKRWMASVGHEYAGKAQKTAGKKQTAISQRKEKLTERLSELCLPEIIVPKFHLTTTDSRQRTLVTINDGSIGYQEDNPLILNIALSVRTGERIAIMGDNGSGKSTLIKAILDHPKVLKSGNWHTPKTQDIGYLDQYYGTLSPKSTALETMQELVPDWSHAELRKHLNDFLFRKNEEVNAPVETLSGGEKARLTLAQIAAKTPNLLILDEITNNLDLETREHVIQVIKKYPGAIILISHDENFLTEIGVSDTYHIENKTIVKRG